MTDLSVTELEELMEIRAGLFEVVIRKMGTQASPEWLQIFASGTERLEQLAIDPDGADDYAETTYRLIILFESSQESVRQMALRESASVGNSK